MKAVEAFLSLEKIIYFNKVIFSGVFLKPSYTDPALKVLPLLPSVSLISTNYDDVKLKATKKIFFF